MSNRLELYHKLPPRLRSAAATAHGYRLRWWRQAPDFEARVAAAAARDAWSPAQWRDWREARLAELLYRAVHDVPYYRDLWADRARRGDRRSWRDLTHWPILEKETVRRQPDAFLVDQTRRPRLHPLYTSGTSGTPLRLWQSRATLTEWYAQVEARRLRWFGVSRHDRYALIGGQLVVPFAQHRPPFWVWNGALNQLYMSSYHLAPDTVGHYLAALERYDVRYLWGYSSSLYALARGALASGWTGRRPVVCLTSAEPLLTHQRVAIEQAFGRVSETYGMTEIVAAANECPSGTWHEWPDTGITEIVAAAGEPVAPGETGDLVATGLINTDMPLIRYRVGDRAKRPHAAAAACGCGRSLPIYGRIDGRSDDVLFTADGRAIGRLDPVFKGDLPLHAAQIVQTALDHVVVYFEPTAAYAPGSLQPLSTAIRQRMGNISVTLTPVARIPRGANGKFKAVVCRLAPETLAAARSQVTT